MQYSIHQSFLKKKYFFSWERFPALYIFASLVSGALLAKGIFFTLLFAFTHKRHSFKIGYLCLASLLAALFYFDQTDPPISKKQLVKAYIKPVKLKKSNHRHYLLAEVPYLITHDGASFNRLKVVIPISKKNRPKFNHDFILEGILKKGSFGYFLHPSKWHPVKRSVSLTERRFQWKKKAKKIISNYTADEDITAYFSSLVTGNISDSFIKERFGACGMLHTLAISGFHFSWMIFLLSIPLSIFLPKRASLILLLFFAWGYFLFLGSSSSISRSFLAITIYLISILFASIPLPLNALGIAGIISIIIDPYSIFDLSFELSFLATFAILTLYPLITSMTNRICMKRFKGTLLLMPVHDKIAYYFLRAFLSSGLLSFVIQVILLPILLNSFAFISLWGIFYNIFFPLTMIPTLVLLLLAFAIHPCFFHLNELYSKIFLESLLYGNGHAFMLLKIPLVNTQILSFISCIFIFLCLVKEKSSHEKHLITQDEFLLT